MTQDDARRKGLAAMRMMMPDAAADFETGRPSGAFGSELNSLSIDNVFSLWSRPGLDPRSRSMVTLGILIALRAHRSLGNHVEIAQRLGISRTELEEIFYHASGYAGFPAAADAIEVARPLIT